jgi:prepilin-type N-terminal cleavage/methylation domain-containing protein
MNIRRVLQSKQREVDGAESRTGAGVLTRLGARRSPSGFTLIEVLVAMALLGVLLALSAGPLRRYWINQSLEGGRSEVVSTLRQLQQQAVSESNPLVFGAGFDVGTGQWATLKYTPGAPATCTKIESHDKIFNTSVYVVSANFAPPLGVDLSKCPAGTGDEYVFFHARGTATSGNMVLGHTELTRTRTIRVSELTSRIESN